MNCAHALIFFSHQHPHPKTHTLVNDTLTYRQTVVSPTPTTCLPLPLHSKHKPVMWLTQIMRWEFYGSSLWGWQQHRPACSLPGIRRPLLTLSGSLETGRRLSPKSSSNALQSGRSRVDLRMTSREWQWLSRPTPTATCQSRKHKGPAAAPAILQCMGRTHSGREGEHKYRKCVFLPNRGRFRQCEVHRRDRVAAECFFAVAILLLKH